MVTNGPSWLSWQTINPVTTTTMGGAGLNAIQSPLFGYGATNPADVNGRFTSSRLVRYGIKIIPTSNITVK